MPDTEKYMYLAFFLSRKEKMQKNAFLFFYMKTFYYICRRR